VPNLSFLYFKPVSSVISFSVSVSIYGGLYEIQKIVKTFRVLVCLYE